MYIVVREVIAGFDFKARTERRKDFLGHDPAGHAGGTYCTTVSYIDTQHRLRGGSSQGGYVYTLTRLGFCFFGGAKSSIIVAPGQTECDWQEECDDEDDDDDRAHSAIPQVAKYQLHSARSINRAISIYTYIFSIGPGN